MSEKNPSLLSPAGKAPYGIWRALRKALDELGERGGTFVEIFDRALVYRPHLGELEATRSLHAHLQLGVVELLAPGIYRLNLKPPNREQRKLARERRDDSRHGKAHKWTTTQRGI